MFLDVVFLLRNGNPSVLQVNFETLDFMHLYDLYRWKFLQAMNNNGAYWSEFVNILGIQFHELLYIIVDLPPWLSGLAILGRGAVKAWLAIRQGVGSYPTPAGMSSQVSV